MRRAGAPCGLALGSMALKGGVFPWLLFRALREAVIGREMRPFVGYVASVLIGVAVLAGAFLLSAACRRAAWLFDALLVPVALFSILAGLVPARGAAAARSPRCSASSSWKTACSSLARA